MYDPNFNPSLKIDSFLGDTFFAENERFLLFLKAYYEWLQTTKITYTTKTGTFQRDEIVTGLTSGSTGTVKQTATGELVILVTSDLPFELGETLRGATSSATLIIETLKDNVVRASGQLLENRTIEHSVDKYVDYLREELYDSIPKEYYGNKRLLALKFKNFFESKSNEQSYRFLFKLLYNQDVEFYYPGEDVLRVSDGNFEKTEVIRAVVTDRIFEFLEKTIRGQTSGVLANVVDIKKFFIGSREVAEMTLKLVSGTFGAGETIVDIEDATLNTTIYGMVTGFTINDAGSGYSVADVITITGDGMEAEVAVSSIKESPISALKVNAIGHGYRLNTSASINNSGTGGSGLIARVTGLANTYTITSGNNTYTAGEVSQVSVINRGGGYFKSPTITLQDSTIASLGLLSASLITIANTGSNYGVGNTLVFTGGAGANAAGQIASVTETISYDFLFEDGYKMLSEDSYYDIIKNEDWSVIGPIKRIELTNFGTGYTSANLPSITISSTTGSNASLTATNIQGKSASIVVDTANNVAGIGSIRALQIKNFGVNYSAANASATAVGDGNANLTPIITGLGIKEGNWINDDGKIDYKYIQDSYFYQDFSYVVKSGIAFLSYADTVKQIIHPAGLQFFGEILLKNSIDVNANFLFQEITSYVIEIISSTLGGVVDVQLIIDQLRQEYELIIESGPHDAAIVMRDLYTKYFFSLIDDSIVQTETETQVKIQTVNDASNPLDSTDRSLSVIITPTKANTEINNIADTTTTRFVEIVGTVTSSNSNTYSTQLLSSYSSIVVNTLYSKTFNDTISQVIGTGTLFLSDFAVGDVFIANNEYFRTATVLTNTLLSVDRDPVTPFTNVKAYRVVGPTYAFSSIPTSIDEGDNGTFTVATTSVGNGTTLYWTIDNITTNSGDFS